MKKLTNALINKLTIRTKFRIARSIAADQEFGRIYGHEIMAKLAPSANIIGFVADGKHGPIESAPNDLSVHKTYALTGHWAKSTVTEITAFFDTNGSSGTYLDIGANIGLTTIPVAQRFSSVKCLAFEPEPNMYSHLRSNIRRLCEYGNVSLFNIALFNSTCHLTLEIAEGNLGDNRIRTKPGDPDDIESQRKTVTVKAMPLDDLDGDIVEPLAVKIDTQGAEPFIFSGGMEVLARAGIIIMEWCPYMMRRMRGDYRVISEFLLSTRFSKCTILEREDPSDGVTMPLNEALKLLEKNFERDQKTDIYYDLILKTEECM